MYKQWITIHLINSMHSGHVYVKHAILEYGRFHRNGDRNDEISTEMIDQTQVAPGSSVNINSCGNPAEASGTEGSIELYDGYTRIAKVHWPCHLGNHSSEFGISELNDHYWIKSGAWDADSAIGFLDVQVGRKD
ncbi:hypothetical protein CBS147333_1093 [Penicillium roqueforti]|nr:hypothetical protein CBS147333_1093 [Penicillium roqueforti]KAI3276660.1 hypothetical protein CBS147308_1297 [Penicillium roqueforti]KAI3288891.1 hypothetical protein DTO002I6_7050 [Penicillium roqueforti]KAI3298029.1 hypothetical protein DTO003C3_631 [Penicillium roqueforti]